MKPGNAAVFSANEAEGYHFVKMVIDGTEYTDRSVMITIPDHDITVTAYFKKDPVITCVVEPSGSGSVTEPPASVKPGHAAVFGANEAEGYYFVSMVIDDTEYTDRSVMITIPDHDFTVRVVFAANPTISWTADPSEGGTVNAPVAAKPGLVTYASAQPAEGYHFVKLVIDGTEYTSQSVNFEMPDHAVTVTAYFAED